MKFGRIAERFNYLDLVRKDHDEAKLPWIMERVRHHDKF